MQAIETRYIAATNRKQARIRARAQAGEIIITYPHEAPDTERAHLTAAIALCRKMGWDDVTLVTGAVPSNTKGYVFCQIPNRNPWNVTNLGKVAA